MINLNIYQTFFYRILFFVVAFFIPSIGSGQSFVQCGFSWTHEDIFISKSEGSDITNIHIYGWGSLWPFPDGIEGEYDDGTSINNRIKRAVADGQDVMLTLATAPSTFRKSGIPWVMEERVSPEYEDLFVDRIKELLESQADIKYVQVWNEFKGYWDEDNNRWDYEGYTSFYNKVYTEIKKVRNDILVGGGYMSTGKRGFGWDKNFNGVYLDSRDMDAMSYWMKNATGFDAVCIDAHLDPGQFSHLTNYLKELPESNGKPIWWSEFYNRTGTMLDCAKDIASALEPGDKMLWWAAQKFMPFSNPIILVNENSPEIEHLLVYPNPTKSFITIQGNVSNNARFEIISVFGQSLIVGEITPGKRQIDLSNLEPNLYFIRFGDNVLKIIKIE